MLPDLKVIKKISAGQFNTKKVIPPIPFRRQFLSSSLNDLDTTKSQDLEEQGSSSYRYVLFSVHLTYYGFKHI